MKLAPGQVDKCPFDGNSVSELKQQVVETLQRDGIHMSRTSKDRVHVPIDFSFLAALLTAAQDPEVELGDFVCGVRVGPGVRLPRLPALYPAKRKWRLPEQSNPLDHMEGDAGGESAWRRNHTSLQELSDKVVDVLEDQARRGQVLKFTEPEARARFPNLVVASLGAKWKDKPNGTVTARVLFDGTHGISVNKRTRIRDQERAPIAADLKRSMREKAREGLTTFALTADVSAAHRQVPIDERDWHLLGCQVVEGQEVYVHTVGTFGVASASYHWSRVSSAIGRLSQNLAGDTAQTKLVGQSIGQRSWQSLCCVQFQVPHSHGTKLQEETSYPGSDSRSSSDLTSLVHHKEELSGSRDGPVRSLRQVTSISVLLRKAQAE